MKKKVLVPDVKPQSKPWGKMSKAEFLKATTDAIIAGRTTPPEKYVSNGKLIDLTMKKTKESK